MSDHHHGHDLYPIHSRIFAGVTEHQFVSYVLNRTADRSKVRIYRGTRGEIAGYAALHAFDKVIEGRSVTVFRAEAGLLPEYRGQDTTFSFFARESSNFRRCSGSWLSS